MSGLCFSVGVSLMVVLGLVMITYKYIKEANTILPQDAVVPMIVLPAATVWGVVVAILFVNYELKIRSENTRSHVLCA